MSEITTPAPQAEEPTIPVFVFKVTLTAVCPMTREEIIDEYGDALGHDEDDGIEDSDLADELQLHLESLEPEHFADWGLGVDEVDYRKTRVRTPKPESEPDDEQATA